MPGSSDRCVATLSLCYFEHLRHDAHAQHCTAHHDISLEELSERGAMSAGAVEGS